VNKLEQWLNARKPDRINLSRFKLLPISEPTAVIQDIQPIPDSPQVGSREKILGTQAPLQSSLTKSLWSTLGDLLGDGAQPTSNAWF